MRITCLETTVIVDRQGHKLISDSPNALVMKRVYHQTGFALMIPKDVLQRNPVPGRPMGNAPAGDDLTAQMGYDHLHAATYTDERKSALLREFEQ